MGELTAEEVKRWAEIIGKPAGAHKTQLEQWCVTASGLLLQLLQAQTWKPIETAPKDGTWIFAKFKNSANWIAIRWEEKIQCWVSGPPDTSRNVRWLPEDFSAWAPSPDTKQGDQGDV